MDYSICVGEPNPMWVRLFKFSFLKFLLKKSYKYAKLVI